MFTNTWTWLLEGGYEFVRPPIQLHLIWQLASTRINKSQIDYTQKTKKTSESRDGEKWRELDTPERGYVKVFALPPERDVNRYDRVVVGYRMTRFRFPRVFRGGMG